MSTFAHRNCLLYIRNKRAIISSFIAAIVVILLYVCFLGDNIKSDFTSIHGIDFLMNSWIVAGFISLVSISTTMGAISLMIRDKESGVYKDIATSPLKEWQIVGGYVLSSYIWGVIMTLFSVVISELCLVFLANGQWLTLMEVVQLIGAILLMVLASTTMLFFVVSIFDKMETFATVQTIIATLTGFLTGCYVPLGSLPETAATVVKSFPLTYGVVLIRKIMTQQAIENTVDASNRGEVETFKSLMGITLSGQKNDWLNQTSCQIGILLLSSLIFFLAAILVVSKRNKQ